MVKKLTGRLRKSIELIGNPSNKKILNIGCKGAWLENYMSKNNIRLKEMHSFDITNYDFPKLGKKYNFSIDSALDMKKYYGKRFDIVTFFEVIEHLPEGTEKIVLTNINKSLKPKGLLIISTPNESFFSNLLDPAYWLIKHRHYSAVELISLLKKKGFGVKKIEVKGGFAESFSMIFYYVFKHVLRSKKLGLNLFENGKDYEYGPNYKGFVNLFIVAEKVGETI